MAVVMERDPSGYPSAIDTKSCKWYVSINVEICNATGIYIKQ